MSRFLGHSTALDEPLVLTGHSLGGGIAQIVAARLGLQSLLFSAPGDTFLAKAFDIQKQPALKYVNIKPEVDLVPRVDEQSGVVQPILCRNKDGTLGSASTCHQILKTACELW